MNNQKINLSQYLNNLLEVVRKDTPQLASKSEFYFKQNVLKFYERNYLNIKSNEQFNFDELNLIAEMSFNDLKGIDNTFLFGFRYFYNLKIRLKKGVFVPQPDSEGLVDLVMKNHKHQHGLEVGFGSGAISIALEVFSTNKMTAIDKNPLALELAIENQHWHNSSVNFLLMDFLKYETNQKYDFIVSNPPYIKEGDKNVSDWVQKNQPHEALYSKDDGLYFIKQLINKSKDLLKSKGKLYFEIGYKQKDQLEKYLKNKVLYTFHKDLNDNYRYVEISYENIKKNKA